ncbi:hypothetical protein GN316_00190 [Xylophilus sp. Kf1]|nr:hypothetical protein [Xylophilus sp. Kf1]
MGKFQVRVISDSPGTYRWLVADHIWDGISAPIAVSELAFSSEEDALAAGIKEMERIEGEPARDHPYAD